MVSERYPICILPGQINCSNFCPLMDNPFECIAASPDVFATLKNGYADDLRRATHPRNFCTTAKTLAWVTERYTMGTANIREFQQFAGTGKP